MMTVSYQEQFLLDLNKISIALFIIIIFSSITGYWKYVYQNRDLRKIKRRSKSQKFTVTKGISLYGTSFSPHTRQVIMMLEEKSLIYEFLSVDYRVEQTCRAFMNISPSGELPTLVIYQVPRFNFFCNKEPLILQGADVIMRFLDVNTNIKTDDYKNDDFLQLCMWQDWLNQLKQNVENIAEYNLSSLGLNIFKVMCLNENSVRQNEDELEANALSCYRLLIDLEEKLSDNEFLIDNMFCAADMSVYSMMDIMSMVGIPLYAFPFINAYMRRIRKKRSCKQSLNSDLKWCQFLFTHSLFRKTIFFLDKKFRKSSNCSWYNAEKCISRALGEASMLHKEVDLSICQDHIVLYDYIEHPECWAIKLLTMYQGLNVRMEIKPCVDLVGRQTGVGNVHKAILMSGTVVTGTIPLLLYLSTKDFTHDLGAYRTDVQWWVHRCHKIYEDTLYYLMEERIFSPRLHSKYNDDEILGLRSKTFYKTTFLDILKVYSYRVDDKILLKQWKESFPSCKLIKPTENTRNILFARVQDYMEFANFQLKKTGEYVCGSKLTVADMTTYCIILVLPYVGVKISSRKYPYLCDWINKLKQITVFRAIHDQFQTAI